MATKLNDLEDLSCPLCGKVLASNEYLLAKQELEKKLAEGRVKQKNVSRDPHVAISIIEQNNPYNMLTIRGKVIEQTSNGADDHIDKLAKRYLGVDKYPFRSQDEKRVILKVQPEKVFYMKP